MEHQLPHVKPLKRTKGEARKAVLQRQSKSRHCQPNPFHLQLAQSKKYIDLARIISPMPIIVKCAAISL